MRNTGCFKFVRGPVVKSNCQHYCITVTRGTFLLTVSFPTALHSGLVLCRQSRSCAKLGNSDNPPPKLSNLYEYLTCIFIFLLVYLGLCQKEILLYLQSNSWKFTTHCLHIQSSKVHVVNRCDRSSLDYLRVERHFTYIANNHCV